MGVDDRKARVREQFDRIVGDYDAGPGHFAHFGERLVDVAAPRAGDRVLDVATGRGAVLVPASVRVGAEGAVTGVDLSPGMVGATNELMGRLGRVAEVLVMDAEQLTFADGSFDCVLCGFGVMFFPEAERALRDFRRVLRKGGTVGLTTWRRPQTEDLAVVMGEIGMEAPLPPGWITEAHRLSGLLEGAGFHDVHVLTEEYGFRFAGIDQYLEAARGTGFRGVLDQLDGEAAQRVLAMLAERLRQYQVGGEFEVPASALIATARS